MQGTGCGRLRTRGLQASSDGFVSHCPRAAAVAPGRDLSRWGSPAAVVGSAVVVAGAVRRRGRRRAEVVVASLGAAAEPSPRRAPRSRSARRRRRCPTAARRVRRARRRPGRRAGARAAWCLRRPPRAPRSRGSAARTRSAATAARLSGTSWMCAPNACSSFQTAASCAFWRVGERARHADHELGRQRLRHAAHARVVDRPREVLRHDDVDLAGDQHDLEGDRHRAAVGAAGERVGLVLVQRGRAVGPDEAERDVVLHRPVGRVDRERLVVPGPRRQRTVEREDPGRAPSRRPRRRTRGAGS